jgi:hypothetical protein
MTFSTGAKSSRKSSSSSPCASHRHRERCHAQRLVAQRDRQKEQSPALFHQEMLDQTRQLDLLDVRMTLAGREAQTHLAEQTLR